MTFPIDVSAYKPLTIDPATKKLSAEQMAQLKSNIQLVRDTIVFFGSLTCDMSAMVSDLLWVWC